MLHTPVQGQPIETPLAVYLDRAYAQIAKTRATSNELNGTRQRDAELARAIAELDPASDQMRGL